VELSEGSCGAGLGLYHVESLAYVSIAVGDTSQLKASNFLIAISI
jgi:hypothetical protein